MDIVVFFNLTSFICRNSLVLKLMAALAIGQRSSGDGVYSIFVRTANATGFVLQRSSASLAERV